MKKTILFFGACALMPAVHAADATPAQELAAGLVGPTGILRTMCGGLFSSNMAADVADEAIAAGHIAAEPTGADVAMELNTLHGLLAGSADVYGAFDQLMAYTHEIAQTNGYWKALRNLVKDGHPSPFNGDPDKAVIDGIMAGAGMVKMGTAMNLIVLADPIQNYLLEYLIPAGEHIFFETHVKISLFEFHAVVTHLKVLRDTGTVITQAIVDDSFTNVHDDYMCNALDGTDDAALATWDVEVLVPWTHTA